MNLTWLSPAVQAEIVELEAVDGVEPMSERPLRAVLREMGWGAQARVWARLASTPEEEAHPPEG